MRACFRKRVAFKLIDRSLGLLCVILTTPNILTGTGVQCHSPRARYNHARDARPCKEGRSQDDFLLLQAVGRQERGGYSK